MNTDAPGVPLRSPTTAAERMRLYRRRRRRGRRPFKVELDVADIDALVKRGYLDPKERDDLSAIAWAATGFLSDALGAFL